MKKKIFMFTLILAACVVIVGCGKAKDSEEEDLKLEGETTISGGWTTVISDLQFGLDEEEIALFDKATDNYTGVDLEPLAILGTQIVAGKNYMFLAKGTPTVPNPETSYKIVIVYKDLKGNAEITKVSDVDFSKYAGTNKDNPNEELDGGWAVEAPGKLNVLDDEKVEAACEKATETLTGMTYNPIAIVGKQVVAGTNYAILCYARGSYQGAQESIYLVTLYDGVDGTKEIIYTSYIDLAEFNK